jgi:hypothetical protein
MGVFKLARSLFKSTETQQAYDRVVNTFPGYKLHMEARKEFAPLAVKELQAAQPAPQGKVYGISYGAGQPKAALREAPAKTGKPEKVQKAPLSLAEFVRAELASGTRH